MCLGSVVDAGVSLKDLEKELRKIPVAGYRLSQKKVDRAHIAACNVTVIQKSEAAGRTAHLNTWEDIKGIIHRSSLSAEIKQKGLKIFRRLFEAEAAVHGKTLSTVHLHELSAVDCIIDIFGTVIGLNMLSVEKIYSSPINLGSGSVKTVSGILPVPAPATAEILKNVPVYSHLISTELTTPTGAAIIKELSGGFGDIPIMAVERIGIGAGDRDFKEWPNVLRVFIGTPCSLPSHKGQSGRKMPVPESSPHESVIVIETNIDDMNPQIFEYVIEKLFKTGALDAYLTQIIMKKGRPAVKLTVLCSEDRKEDLIKIILEETSTIGLRFYETKRRTLRREIKTIDTEFGKVRVKYSRYNSNSLKATPEYEDCKKIAKKLKIPIMEVMKKIK